MTTEPLWTHQRETLDASWDLPAYFLDWEPRVGKSRVAIETAKRLADDHDIHGRPLVEAAVVLAPSGVHLNWSREQLPRYWAKGQPETLVIEWQSAKTKYGWFKQRLAVALKRQDVPFVWFVANSEALSTSTNAKKPGKLEAFLRKLLRARRCLLVVDESHDFKDPKSKRTKALLRLADLAPYRRCLTGTPAPQGPFDLWSQYHVLDPTVLGPRFTTFKARYGVFELRPYLPPRSNGELVDYQNLDELRELVAPITSTRRKEDCLDLPDRIFTRRYFELPPAHRKVYDALKRDALARLDDGEEVTVSSALTLLLRLQQVTRGHVRPDVGQPVRGLGAPYPAAEATCDLVKSHDGKAIVWCRFTEDVDTVAAALTLAGIDYVACDGRTPTTDRPGLRDRFRDDPACRVWLGTAATGGVGVDLGAASLMVNYSHSYNLVHRLQSLERNFGSTQAAERIDVVDLVAADATDSRILDALDRKEDLGEQIRRGGLRPLLG